jgi:Zn-dependent protease
VKQSIRLGRVGGVPIGVNWSVLVIFGLVTWELADIVLPSQFGGGTRVLYWVAAFVAAVAFFVSLLAHEGSHAVVARRQGVGVRSITLWLFGGVAQLDGEAHSPGADFAIAVVGPGASLVLVGVFGALQLLLERAGVHGVPVFVATWLWQINLLLAGFNLIPAAPLDGGRILRAALWRLSGDQTRAAVRAARVGVAFGVVLVGLGALEVVLQSAFGLWLVFLGWFLLMAARGEEATARELGSVKGLAVEDVMDRRPPVLPTTMTVAELAAGHFWHGGTAAAVIEPGGFLAGVTTLDRLHGVPERAWTTTRIADIAAPLATVPVGRPDEPMPELLGRMYAAEGCPAIVLDADNRLAGVVSVEDVERVGTRRSTRTHQHDLSGTAR